MSGLWPRSAKYEPVTVFALTRSAAPSFVTVTLPLRYAATSVKAG